jgi:hypothetical protein
LNKVVIEDEEEDGGVEIEQEEEKERFVAPAKKVAKPNVGSEDVGASRQTSSIRSNAFVKPTARLPDLDEDFMLDEEISFLFSLFLIYHSFLHLYLLLFGTNHPHTRRLQDQKKGEIVCDKERQKREKKG